MALTDEQLDQWETEPPFGPGALDVGETLNRYESLIAEVRRLRILVQLAEAARDVMVERVADAYPNEPRLSRGEERMARVLAEYRPTEGSD